MPRPASISRSCTSRSRHTSPSIGYSLSPDRYSRRATSTSRTTVGSSSRSIPSIAGGAGASPGSSLGSTASRPSIAATTTPCPFPFPLPWPWPGACTTPWPLSPARRGAAGGPNSRAGTDEVTPVSLSFTSAAAVGLRASLPPKITSSIRSPRRLRALCSPSTHVMASTRLLLPQPLGPTMAVTPRSKASSDRSGKLLNPESSRRCSRILRNPLPDPGGFAPADPPTRSLTGPPGSPLRSRGARPWRALAQARTRRQPPRLGPTDLDRRAAGNAVESDDGLQAERRGQDGATTLVPRPGQRGPTSAGRTARHWKRVRPTDR